jgi:hypothetical protein
VIGPEWGLRRSRSQSPPCHGLTYIERLDAQSGGLRAAAGTATVTDNLARVLAAALDPNVVRIISLVCSRQDLLARLRLTTPTGIPVAIEITKMIAAYLTTGA